MYIAAFSSLALCAVVTDAYVASIFTLHRRGLYLRSRNFKPRTNWYQSMTSNPKSEEKREKLTPPKETIDDALRKAKYLIQNAGGCIDSISFGAAWKQKYPDFPRERFHGTSVSSFNKLFKVATFTLRILFSSVIFARRYMATETSL